MTKLKGAVQRETPVDRPLSSISRHFYYNNSQTSPLDRRSVWWLSLEGDRRSLRKTISLDAHCMESAVDSEANITLLKEALQTLLDPSALDNVLVCLCPIDSATSAAHPRTALLHVRFNEDKPNIEAMARYLWKQALNYALSRRRRLAFQKAISEADPADVSCANDIVTAARSVFIDFRKKYPSRASEVGEILAYCITIHHLKAAQIAAKMSLKTSSNMPVHGLDGIHAAFQNDALTVYFLESKLSKSANDGASEFAKSTAAFLKNEKQYLREYELICDLSNLDTLTGEAREIALQYFDVINNPQISRRERSVGVICYSEGDFEKNIPVSDGPIDAHEKHFQGLYEKKLNHHQSAALKHITENEADPNKCTLYFVAVPDVIDLREKFYDAMGIKINDEQE